MDIGLSMSLGGSFYRATRNADKVNSAVNSMLNRLETGEKYQYVHENVAAIVEGSTIKGKVNANDIAVDRNDKKRTELETYMTGQKKMLENLTALKEVHTKYNSLDADGRTGTQGLALTEQAKELGKAVTSLSTSVSFNGLDLVGVGTATNPAQVNALTAASNSTYAFTFGAVTIGGIGAVDTTGGAIGIIDAAITELSKNSALSGVYYNNVLSAQSDVMTGIVNASTQRYSKLMAADDNETSALLNVLNNRAGAIQASKQYAGQYTGNAIQLLSLMG